MIFYNPGAFYRPTVNLEEQSIRKQIKTELEKCTYKQLDAIANCYPEEHKYSKNPFHPLNVIHSILSPSASGREAAEEYKSQMMRNLAIEVIAEKFPDSKQPTQLEGYL